MSRSGKFVLVSNNTLIYFCLPSSYGLGAVLKQEHEANEWCPVAFALRTLTKTEQGYAQIEKEALAITWACERFKDFVVGKTFLIETDHKPLVPIFTTKDLNDLTPRLQRYRMRMLQFSFHIFHTPGKDLITADALSRQPLPGHLPEDEELQEEVEHFVRSIVLHQSTTDDRLAKIALNQKLEPTLQNVAFYSKNGWPAKCQLSPLEHSFYDVRDEIGEENGLLMRGLRVIIPSNMRKDVLNRIHAGHQGITKCRARAKDHVWWPGIGQEIQDMVKTCEKCIENQPLKHEPLIPNDFPERSWQKVGMDLFHYEGSEYLVVVDYFSRFIEVVRLTKLSSEAVVDHCKAIFARHGIPDIVISDNGPQFRPSTTSAFTKFASEVGFRHITSSPKHPQSNGQAEAAVKIVKNLMKKNKDPVLALMEYRATPLANGLSPAELLFGRKIRTMVPCTSSSLTPKTVDQSKLRGEEEQRKMAQKTAFDRRHAATKKAELIAGEKVWVKDLRAWGSVLEKASALRSYIVETPIGTYRRNSLLLASSQQQVDPSETSPDSELPAETEETPGNEVPAEELQQLPAIAPEIKQLSPSPGKVSRWEDIEENEAMIIMILLEKQNEQLKPKQRESCITRPVVVLEENVRTRYVPQVKILKRSSERPQQQTPSPISLPPHGMKTLEQREAEYAQARLRILGGGSNPPSCASSTNHPSEREVGLTFPAHFYRQSSSREVGLTFPAHFYHQSSSREVGLTFPAHFYHQSSSREVCLTFPAHFYHQSSSREVGLTLPAHFYHQSSSREVGLTFPTHFYHQSSSREVGLTFPAHFYHQSSSREVGLTFPAHFYHQSSSREVGLTFPTHFYHQSSSREVGLTFPAHFYHQSSSREVGLTLPAHFYHQSSSREVGLTLPAHFYHQSSSREVGLTLPAHFYHQSSSREVGLTFPAHFYHQSSSREVGLTLPAHFYHQSSSREVGLTLPAHFYHQSSSREVGLTFPAHFYHQSSSREVGLTLPAHFYHQSSSREVGLTFPAHVYHQSSSREVGLTFPAHVYHQSSSREVGLTFPAHFYHQSSSREVCLTFPAHFYHQSSSREVGLTLPAHFYHQSSAREVGLTFPAHVYHQSSSREVGLTLPAHFYHHHHYFD
ncbi:K02A2.6-like [Cordylochernes scorpioides]|uniref:RNA-directed DNA polymerase n=1 Tax=Cordylochernes scorpioides TaxID=51811 RepID=A0ABY6L1U0_9ARAC|nr:K02A2.6-like [Cordylochernes scorpioides]